MSYPPSDSPHDVGGELNRDVNWWVDAEMPDEVDSFSGFDPEDVTEDMTVFVFQRYGLWWFHVLVDDERVWTHGPYKTEYVAKEAVLGLVS